MVTFTIITCTYNAATELPRTLQSVHEQTYPYIEHLIIDGASKDNTLLLLTEYKKKNMDARGEHFINIVSEPDKGLYDAMNKSLIRATGDYILFLNSGDSFHEKDTLNKIAAIINSADTTPAVVYGDTSIVDLAGNFIEKRHLSPPEKLTWKSFKKGMLVCHQSFFALTKLTKECFYNNKDYNFSADFDWCIRLMRIGTERNMPLLNSHIIITDYLKGGMTEKNHLKSLIERYHIMAKYYGWMTASFYHGYFAIRAIKRHLQNYI